ncbi:hypothetical protein [Candidatus Protochlamydia amoebophila]|uniref:hypothetical protein n=1 Tax=Candidatus Protochlamydia amoebophila TaxID=362787 RepID=UPI001BCA0874|nr:hypothetical protein [Candidatus Protochlamydia amoebophila]
MNDYTQSTKPVNSPDNLLVNNDPKPNESNQEGSIQGRTLQQLTSTDSDPIKPIEITANKTTNVFKDSNETLVSSKSTSRDRVESSSLHSYSHAENLDEHTGPIMHIGRNAFGIQESRTNQTSELIAESPVNKRTRKVNEDLDELERPEKYVKTKLTNEEENIQITSLAEQIAPNTTTSSETLENLCERTAEHFNISNEDLKELVLAKGDLNAANLLAVCNERLSARFREEAPITKQEIVDIHSILFSPLLADLSEQEATPPIDVINPSPAFVCKSLLNCLQSIEDKGGYTSAIEEAKEFSLSEPKPEGAVKAIIENKTEKEIPAFLETLRGMGEGGVSAAAAYEKYVDDKAQYRTQLQKFPIIESSQIFGGGNVNEVYTLTDEGKPQWIFKPANNFNNNPTICKNEQMASCINYHNQFRVPLTVLIDLGEGAVGSAQLFVPDCVKFEDVQKKAELNRIHLPDLQKMVILDLIAGNTDRHEGNLLFQPEQGSYRLYAIDHDQCFQEPDITGKPLNFCYGNLPALKQKFQPEIASLISEEAENNYEQKINSPEEAKWRKLVLKKSRECMQKGVSPEKLIEFLARKWNERM